MNYPFYTFGFGKICESEYLIFAQSHHREILSTIKGTVNVISIDPSCKHDNAWFTTVPLNALSIQLLYMHDFVI